jgi:malonate-semialdehyde dehydrogenase (acetylating) / methylmalonate-semialdehyde dehydrogenase
MALPGGHGGPPAAQVRTDMRSYREEIFGPVLQMLRVDTLEQAIALVSAQPYGNGAALFTRSEEAASCFADQVEVGMVGINVPIPVHQRWRRHH